MNSNSSSFSSSALDRFVASLTIDYDQWREGMGYDVAALHGLSAEDKGRVLALLQHRLDGVGAGWREVEAVAALDNDEARTTLAALVEHENSEVRLRALRLVGGEGRNAPAEKEIIRLLRDARSDVSMRIGPIMTMAQENPTPAMQRALLFCAVDGAPDLRVHAAALALHLAGRTKEPFDWKFRPLFLEFGESDRAVRLAARVKLRALIRGDVAPA